MAQRAPWRGYGALIPAVAMLGMLGGPVPPGAADALVFTDLSPNGGEVVAADTSVPMAWNGTHGSDAWFWGTLSYSAGGGAGGFITRGAFPLQGGTHAWRVPRWNSTAARVQVCGTAPDGDSACRQSAADFTILATPPYLDLLSPRDGAANVLLNAPVVLGMENVSMSSVSFTVIPFVSAWTILWSNGDRVVTLTHGTP